MRKTFIKSLCELAEKDSRIWLLTADLGFSFLEEFQKKFPERFINVGVAEQNLIGIASGLALSGKKVFVYSIINFLVCRPLEQIRNCILYHNLDVTLVGVGCGFAYGGSGYTHHGLEDVNYLGSLPNIDIFSPADSIEVMDAIDQCYLSKGPKYLRLDKRSSTQEKISSIDKSFSAQILIVGYGTILSDVKVFLERYEKDISYLSLNKISPFESKKILHKTKDFNEIFFLEEHVESLVSFRFEKIIHEAYPEKRVKKFHVIQPIHIVSGDQNFLRKLSGLSFEKIEEKIRLCLCCDLTEV